VQSNDMSATSESRQGRGNTARRASSTTGHEADDMPRLSVIVPVYNVEPYLRQCLDSILTQQFTDFELIAVDDASTDNSPAILDEYVRTDDRVIPVTLERNGGLGNARHVGLDMARAEHVMFVDSDDWIADDALGAIVARLDATRPDLLLIDYARAYWNGRVQRNIFNEVFREPGLDVFTLEQRPNIFYLLSAAWNKVYRTDWLRDLGLRFTRGYYEDVPVTYPVLMAAERISMLDKVCYYYRQRRSGAITKTLGRGHFDIFDQYESIFAFMDARPDTDQFRSMMFERMIWHYLVILARTGKRIRHQDREEFFRRVTEHYARYEPAGFQPPPGLEHRIKYALLKRDAYAAYQVIKGVNRLRLRARSRAVRSKVQLRRRAWEALVAARQLLYRQFLRLPMDDNLAIFAAYWYRGVTGNPRAVYDKMRELAPHIRGVWVVERDAVDRVPPDVEYVVDGTIDYYRALARARYMVNNVNFPNFVIKRPGQIHLQTQHGTPLKTMGIKLREYPVAARRMNFAKLLERADRWDYNLSSNRFSSEIWKRDFPCEYKMLEYGYPRNDILHAPDPDEITRFRMELGVPDDRTTVLYAPTFRDYQSSFSLHADLTRLCEALGDDKLLLLRAHYYYDDEGPNPTIHKLQRAGKLIDVSSYPETSHVLLASDILITDYSSVMFDYANLDRPIVLYVHDWDIYTAVRGINFDLLAEPPGAVATSEDVLLDLIRSGAYDTPETRRLRQTFRARFCMFDDGRAAERTVRRVFLDEQVTPPSGELPEEPAHVSTIPATGEARPVGP
jgi:CDP-glycerol glycerophosphotransferase